MHEDAAEVGMHAVAAPRQVAPPRPSRLRRAWRMVERSLAVVGAALLVWHLAFGAAEVISPSMSPTLVGAKAGDPKNDWVLYETVSRRVAAPPRGALVLFQNEDGVSIVKRVAGLAGERLRLVDGQLEVDGALLPPPAPGVKYVRAGVLRPDPAGPRAYDVPQGAVFLLGDDSKDSWDGRYFGGTRVDELRGRAVAVLWPPARWRWVW